MPLRMESTSIGCFLGSASWRPYPFPGQREGRVIYLGPILIGIEEVALEDEVDVTHREAECRRAVNLLG